MIDPVIFSKDRPAQLDLLLKSLHGNGDSLFHEPIVIYRATTQGFADGYEKCFGYHPDAVARHEEKNDFYHLTMTAVGESLPLMCFMVDDQIMWRLPGFGGEQVKRVLDKYTKAPCVSLRLGYNTEWQYQTSHRIGHPKGKDDAPFVVWNRNLCQPYTNYNYPLSVDAHIFRRNEILGWMEQIAFGQPNQLEARLQAFNNRVGPLMISPPTSLFVNAAVNRVQDIFKNKVGGKAEYKPDVLNTRFLEGGRLSLANTLQNGDLKITSCHQEIDLKWEKDDV